MKGGSLNEGRNSHEGWSHKEAGLPRGRVPQGGESSRKLIPQRGLEPKRRAGTLMTVATATEEGIL